MNPMSGRTCLVTGASSGIGKETAARLAELGATVIVHGRDAGRASGAGDEIRARAPRARVEVLAADLSSPAQVRAAAAEVLARHERLDVLVNNAGVLPMRHRVTADGWDVALATNHLGPFLLTGLLRGLLERSAPARVVTVASAAHRQARAVPWDDLGRGLPAGHRQLYPLTKLLNVLFSAELARRLAGTGVTANCLHPGFVRTELGREATGVTGAMLRVVLASRPGPAAGAATSVYLASAAAVAEVTGGYYVRSRAATPSALARDVTAAARLWALSEELCGRSTG